MNKPLRIQSVSNELYRQLKSLKSTRSIKEANICAVHGLRFAMDLLKRKRVRLKYVVCTEAMIASLPQALVQEQNLRLVELDAHLYRDLDEFGTNEPICYCELPVISEWNKASDSSVRSVLLPFQNPDNLGAAIRTAVAFGVRVIVTEESAFAFHPKAIRASAGAVFDCDLVATGKIVDFNPNISDALILDAAGEDISTAQLPQKFVLIPGIEGPGVPDSFSRFRSISIPMTGAIESLNAGVAVGIALYELTRGEATRTNVRHR